jgi:hypothetical protein
MELTELKIIIFILVFIALLSRCDDRYETILPPSAPDLKSTTLQVPIVAFDKTRDLFDLLIKKDVGDKVGLVELRSEGILIHPGETHPTKVYFKFSRTYQKLLVRPFIAALPAEAATIKEAGTVGVEFFINGKSEKRMIVNRDTVDIVELDLSNTDLFTVVVDNGDGKPWFDWFILGVVESK